MELSLGICMLPYARAYKRNTLEPLKAIANERDNARLEGLIEDWIRRKRRESEYVSVAVRYLDRAWSFGVHNSRDAD